MRRVLLTMCLALLPSAGLAAPPPPPPPFIDDAAKTLTTDLTPRTFDAYAKLFAADLQVVVDGRVVAFDRRSWLAAEQSRLGKAERRLVAYAEGEDNVLVLDEFDDRSDVPERPGSVFDPRFVSRALRYRFGPDHLVHEIMVVQGGGFLRTVKPGG